MASCRRRCICVDPITIGPLRRHLCSHCSPISRALVNHYRHNIGHPGRSSNFLHRMGTKAVGRSFWQGCRASSSSSSLGRVLRIYAEIRGGKGKWGAGIRYHEGENGLFVDRRWDSTHIVVVGRGALVGILEEVRGGHDFGVDYSNEVRAWR